MGRRVGLALSREQVVGQALEYVERDGADQLSLASVARGLGVQTPSLYYYVSGNQELRELAVIEGWRRLGGAILSAAPEERPGPALRLECHAYRQWALDHPEVYRLMSAVSVSPSDPRFVPVATPIFEHIARRVSPSGNADPAAIVHASRLIRSVLHGFISLEVSGQFNLKDFDVDETFETLVDMVVLQARKARRQ